MGKLSAAQRKNLAKSQFAIPSKEPVQNLNPDKSHARNALARVSQHGTSEEKATVRAKVKKKFPDIGVSPEGIQGAKMKRFKRKR